MKLYRVQADGPLEDPIDVEFGVHGGSPYYCDADIPVARGDVLVHVVGGRRDRVTSADRGEMGAFEWLEVKVEQMAANEPFVRSTSPGIVQNVYGNIGTNAAVVNVSISVETLSFALQQKAEELRNVEGKQGLAEKLKNVALDKILVPIVVGVINEHIRQAMRQ